MHSCLAIEAGASIVNDISGLRFDPAMARVVAAAGVPVILMHIKGTPRDMQKDPVYSDLMPEVIHYLRHSMRIACDAGIDGTKIVVDPGIGFGKTVPHNLALLSRARRLHELGSAVVIGHSRKRFISKVLGPDRSDVLAGTIGVAAALARQGVQVLRVHDVAAVRQALLLFEAAGGLE
jgi:dihydropteroate synthase